MPHLQHNHLRPAFFITLVLLQAIYLMLPAESAARPVIIGFHAKPGAKEEKLMHDHAGKIKHKFRHISAYAADLSDDARQLLQHNPKVKYVVEDTLYQVVDPLTASADPAEYDNSWGVKHIGSMVAHTNSITGSGVLVAVLDTGVDYTHPQLAPNYRGGWDVVFNDDDPFDDSWNSHGTHVAGIIAAAADGAGTIGVAPDAGIYAIKVLDGGGFGLLSWIIEGIEKAMDAGADIVNISIGGPSSAALQDACDTAFAQGVLLIAAAGNGSQVAYPAAYDSVIAVTGTDTADLPGWFAPTGPQVELAAPGVFIRSTVVNNAYSELSGTSQAAPHVTGLAALIYSDGTSDLNNDGVVDQKDVRLQLRQSAQDLGEPGNDETYGFGLISVENALNLGGGSDPGSTTFTLTRKPRSYKDTADIDVSGSVCTVTVTNDSLQGVRMLVYEGGLLRRDLSETILFAAPKSPQEAGRVLDATDTAYHLVFLPLGRAGASATITIAQ